MPFIEQWRRDVIDKHGLLALGEIAPGDRCYVYYKDMMKQWRKKPCWTTAHSIARDLSVVHGDPDEDTACGMAFMVFFNLHVMPCELKKREENGDI